MRTIFRKAAISLIFIMLIAIPGLPAESRPAWSEDMLDQPLSIDGSINRDGNSFSFILNDQGIPNEPVRIIAHLRSDIDESTGIPEGSDTPLYNPETLSFNPSNELVYIGAELLNIAPGTTTYTENNNQTEFSGSNVDLIKGAKATLNISYNPAFTHQTGVIWYVVDEGYGFDDFEYIGGGSQATINAETATFKRGSGGSTRSITLRALSIYDPWFDDMELRYDSRYGDDGVRVDNWKSKYIAMTNSQHLSAGMTSEEITAMRNELMAEGYTEAEANETIAAVSEEYRSMWGYPGDNVTTGYYTDYQITVREPIESTTFRSEAQTQTNKGEAYLPEFAFINDQLRHPDITATDEIWCYDTSDASLGSKSVDAFYVSADLVPDYGYTLDFELVEGSGIGELDFTNVDAIDNAFRFIPHGARKDAMGNTVTNYGDVVIRATATDVNYSKLFTLHYLPSNIRIVKYIGDNWESNNWNHGVVLNADGKTVNDDLSGEWDVYWASDSDRPWENTTLEPSIYGFECLTLYPGETFPLAAMAFVRPDGNAASKKQPYYITSGTPAVDTSIPDDGTGSNIYWTKYAVTYGVYSNADSSTPVPGVLSFGSGYAERVEKEADGTTYEELVPTSEDTGRSNWFYTDSHEITVNPDAEGVYYLSYTIAPNEDAGPSLENGAMSGGFYFIVSQPVDQVLLDTVQGQTNMNVSLEIPFAISAGQRKAPVVNGKEMPSHWFLGPVKGAVAEEAIIAGDTEDLKPIYRGKALVAFNKDIDLRFIEGLNSLTDVTYIEDMRNTVAGSVNDYFEISIDTLSKGLDDMLNKPTLADIRITGDYGLNKFPLITTLYIEDSNGVFTAANTENNVLDLSSMNVRYVEHVGMASAGSKLKQYLLPRYITKLELNGGTLSRNNLNCELVFQPSSKTALEYIDIGNNNFEDMTLSGFTNLKVVKAEGSAGRTSISGGNNNDRYLNIVGGSSLELVQANETQFNYIVAAFRTNVDSSYYHSSRYEEVYEDRNYQQGVVTAFQADGSSYLYGVNLSGSVGYAEVTDNNYLESFVHSSYVRAGSYDDFTPNDSLSSGHWLKVLNFGGSNPLMNNPTSPASIGFNPDSRYTVSGSAFYNGLPWDLTDITSSSGYPGGSNHVKYIKLNRIQKLYSDNNSSKTALGASQILSSEINEPISALPLLYVNIADGYAYYKQEFNRDSDNFDFYFKRATSFKTIQFDGVEEATAVNMDMSSGTSAVSSQISELNLNSMYGYYSMRNNSSLKKVSANEYESQLNNSTLDLAYSGITSIQGREEMPFNDMIVGIAQNVTMTEGDAIDVFAYPIPLEYSNSFSFDVTSSNPDVVKVEMKSGTVRLLAKEPGVAIITVVGSVIGESAHPVYTSTVAVISADGTVNNQIFQLRNTQTMEAGSEFKISEAYYGSGYPLGVGFMWVDDYGILQDGTNAMFNGQFDSSVSKVEWKISDTSLASISTSGNCDQNVRIYPKKATGKFKISAHIITDGGNIDLEADVILEGDLYDIKLSDTDVVFHSEYDNAIKVNADLINNDTGKAANGEMTESFRWYVSNSSIASIEASGTNNRTITITPKKRGTTTFCVTYREYNSQGFEPDVATGTITINGLTITISTRTATVTYPWHIFNQKQTKTVCTATLKDSVTGETVSKSGNVEFKWNYTYTRLCSNTGHTITVSASGNDLKAKQNWGGWEVCNEGFRFYIYGVRYGNYTYGNAPAKDITFDEDISEEAVPMVIESYPVTPIETREETSGVSGDPVYVLIEGSSDGVIDPYGGTVDYEVVYSDGEPYRLIKELSADPKLDGIKKTAITAAETPKMAKAMMPAANAASRASSSNDSYVCANVETLIVDGCPISNIYLGTRYSSATAKVRVLHANNLSITGLSLIQMWFGLGFRSVIIDNSSYLEEIQAENSYIRMAIINSNGLETADLSGNSIGSGVLKLPGGFVAANHIITQADKLDAYADFDFTGNGIYDLMLNEKKMKFESQKSYRATDYTYAYIKWYFKHHGWGGDHAHLDVTISGTALERESYHRDFDNSMTKEYTYYGSSFGVEKGDIFRLYIHATFDGWGSSGSGLSWGMLGNVTARVYPFGS